MRAVHRILSLCVVVFLLYLGVTGTLIQVIDLQTLLTHAPAKDPDMMAIREGHDGPDDYAVRSTDDFTAAALPEGFDFQAAFNRVTDVARASFQSAALDYVEVRMSEAGAVGVVESASQQLRIDLASAESVVKPTPERENSMPPSARNTVKHLHRMTSFGNWILWLNPLVGIALLVFVATGLTLYFQLLAARRRSTRNSWFWSAGGWWRSLHRWVSVCAAVFILIVALSGTWLAVESLCFGIYMDAQRMGPGQPPQPKLSPFSPLRDADLAAMLATTLHAYADSPDVARPIKALRLRTYGGMPQGVVIAGLGDDTQQLVFNATNGSRVSETEAGYPQTGFPFGWRAHQVAKDIHRGDFIGLPGRWMDLFAGLSLVFLCVSGAVMYFDMWTRRRRAGRTALVWK